MQYIHACLHLTAGTPPRIDKSTINFEPLWEQPGDDPPTPFSFINEVKGLQVGVAAAWYVLIASSPFLCIGRAKVLLPDSY